MKPILITGARRGLGRALYEYMRNTKGQAVYGPPRDVLDVTEPESWILTQPYYGELGGIVNVAGIGPARNITEESPEGFEEVMQTNLTSNFLGLRYAAEAIEDGGSFITVSSVIGLRAGPAAAVAYEASKAAQLALVRHAAVALAPRIRVNAIVPGYIADTGMTDVLKGDKFDKYIESLTT